MSLIRRSPFGEGGLLPNLINSFFDESWPFFELPATTGRGFRPAVEVQETESSYIIRAEVPGMKKEDLSIEVKGHSLVLSGEKRERREEKGRGTFRSEIQYGAFERSFYLGETINPEEIDAEFKDGVLTIMVPKREREKRKAVEIKGE